MSTNGQSTDRLIRSFRTVFRGLTDEQIREATPETIAAWDSTTHFTLLAVIEEEFDCGFSDEEIGTLLSFADFDAYLARRADHA